MFKLALLTLITWNGALGAFDGLSFCLHQDAALNVETHSSVASDCESDGCATGYAAESCAAMTTACVDIELQAQRLPPIRIDEVSMLLSAPDLELFASSSFFEAGTIYTYAAMDWISGLSQPPELYLGSLDLSVLVAECMQLRV